MSNKDPLDYYRRKGPIGGSDNYKQNRASSSNYFTSNDCENIEKEVNEAIKRAKPINLLITGGTGVGKSSTINALFGRQVSDIGTGAKPQTMAIDKYQLGKITLYDSPGFGDSPEKDKIHANKIVDLLNTKNNNNEYLIDMVLIILDATSRDLGSALQLITNVVMKNFSDYSRIIVALNKCDAVLSGEYWDKNDSKPYPELVKKLDEISDTIQSRIYDSTNIQIKPIYYSAGGYDPIKRITRKPYNLLKLLYFIYSNAPVKKRLAFNEHINPDPTVWNTNDNTEQYVEGMKKSFFDALRDNIQDGADYCGNIGKALFGDNGETVGRVVGGVGGFFKTLLWDSWH